MTEVETLRYAEPVSTGVGGAEPDQQCRQQTGATET
jgi:hypothetical protein